MAGVAPIMSIHSRLDSSARCDACVSISPSVDLPTPACRPAGGGGWVEVPTMMSSLLSLRLGLSNIREVALALPALQHLDLNGCGSLRLLELRCPRLLSGLFQRVSRFSSRPCCPNRRKILYQAAAVGRLRMHLLEASMVANVAVAPPRHSTVALH